MAKTRYSGRHDWLQRWLLAWLCLLSLLALLWPWSFDPFVASGPALRYIVALAMFALGWLLPSDEFSQVVRRWPLVIGGTLIQYAAMPLLAWSTSRVLPLSPDLQLGIILVGCVPGAMASNVLTLLAGGNVSYSLMLTTMATCLSPLAVPLTLYLTMSERLDRSFLDLVVQLVWMVLIPVVTGHIISAAAGLKQQGRVLAENTAAVAILWIIAVVVGRNRDAMYELPWVLLAAALIVNLGGYLAGVLGSRLLRLDHRMRRALVLEIGMQNAGLGTALAADLFSDRPAAMIPTALYTFGCMLTGTLLAWYWSRRPSIETTGMT